MTHFGKTLILAAWVLMLVIIVLIMGANVYLMVTGQQNATLENWGSTALGFLFGSFITMVRDFLNLREG